MKVDNCSYFKRTMLPPLFFGPVSPNPSWLWVGADVASYIGKDLEVNFFESLDTIPDGAIVFWIKHPATTEIADSIRKKRLILLFFPVDCFLSPAHITEHGSFIRSAQRICVHSRSLMQFFPESTCVYVDHYRKYGVPWQDRVPGKNSLWIGGYQYVPYVARELAQMMKPPSNVVLLTDLNNQSARDAAALNAEKAGISDFRRYITDGFLSVLEWSEEAQRAAMLTCRAAFDVKFDSCFNQFHKPPTKIQKYAASGIPCAVNPGVAYLNDLGFPVASLNELDTIHERSNSAPVLDLAERLSHTLSLRSVAERYLEIAHDATIESFVGDR